MKQIQIGTYTGNGSNQSVIIGFAPDKIEAFNNTELAKWQSPMSSGAAILIRGATGSMLRIESLGFAQLTTAEYPTGNGFRAGESVNQSGNSYYYEASRNAN